MKDYSKIPEELKNMNQWVCAWDNSKIPMKAFEKKAASSTAPDTWSSFEQAEWAVENGYYDNLGFVFADNGLVGIDIDAGFEDGLMTPLCADIMTACKSYTEKSRSGRGVHILLRGTLPFHGKNNLAGVEIYKARRFFIMTGKQLIFLHWYRRYTLRSSTSQRAARFLFAPITRRLLPGAETCHSLPWQEQCTTRATPRHRFMRN